MSLASDIDEADGDKKKKWYKHGHPKKAIKSAASIISRHSKHKADSAYSMSQSVNNVFEAQNDAGRSQYGSGYGYGDGSVLGASSDIAASELYNAGRPSLSTSNTALNTSHLSDPAPPITPTLIVRSGSRRRIVKPTPVAGNSDVDEEPGALPRSHAPNSDMPSVVPRKPMRTGSVLSSIVAPPNRQEEEEQERQRKLEEDRVMKEQLAAEDERLRKLKVEDGRQLQLERDRQQQLLEEHHQQEAAEERRKVEAHREASIPCLLSVVPDSGSIDGDFEVKVHGRNLTDQTLQHAVLMVDGYTIAQGNWSVQPISNSQSTHCIVLKMPGNSAGRCYIEIETMSHGRMRCPQVFTYTAESSPATSRSAMPPIVSVSETQQQASLESPKSAISSDQEMFSNGNRESFKGRTTNGVVVAGSVASTADSGVALSRQPSMRSSIRLHDDRRRSRRLRPSERLGTVTGIEPISSPLRSRQLSDADSESLLSPTEDERARVNSSSKPASILSTGSFKDSRGGAYSARLSAGVDKPGPYSDIGLSGDPDQLRLSLAETQRNLARWKAEASTLEVKLASQTADVERLSQELCSLRLRLLEDGQTKYLERK